MAAEDRNQNQSGEIALPSGAATVVETAASAKTENENEAESEAENEKPGVSNRITVGRFSFDLTTGKVTNEDPKPSDEVEKAVSITIPQPSLHPETAQAPAVPTAPTVPVYGTLPEGAVLPDNFGRLCEDGILKTYLAYTRNQASPPLFHLWTIIAVIAGILRRNVWINRGGYYMLYPNLYTVLVAPTGRCMKSTAASIGVKLLRKIEGVNIMHEKITPEGLISYMSGEMSDGPALPWKKSSGPKMTVKIEGKSVKFKEECNCFVFAPELSVFLGGVSYTGGLVELLTSLYEGKDQWEYRTKSRGELILKNVNLNLFGASNPEWLAKGLSEDAFGGGFMGRTIYIFQNEGKKVAWPTKPEDMEELEARIVNDLLKINSLEGEFHVTDEARDFYTKWYDNYNPDFNNRMSGFFERKPDHLLKLAMIIAVSKSDKLEITLSHMQAALKMLEEVEKVMPSAFVYIGATAEARTSQHIIELIAGSPHKFISYKNLLAGMRHMIKNRREFDDILDTLDTSGQLKIHVGGSTRYYTIDQDIATRLKEEEKRAEQDAKKEFAEQKKLRLDTPFNSPAAKEMIAKETIRTTKEEASEKLKEALADVIGSDRIQ
jgi:hypothetical protein